MAVSVNSLKVGDILVRKSLYYGGFERAIIVEIDKRRSDTERRSDVIIIKDANNPFSMCDMFFREDIKKWFKVRRYLVKVNDDYFS
jgi:hypothetical protein